MTPMHARSPSIARVYLMVLTFAALASVPEPVSPATDLGAPCDTPASSVCVPWSNGNFDWVDASPSATWGLIGQTRVEDFDGDGDRELVVRGAGADGSFSKGFAQPMLPGHAKLEFDVEASGGRADGLCTDWYDIRVVLLGVLDPLPFVDTLADLAPLLPLDYYNDEVLYWVGQARAGDHIVLDPLRANIINNPAAAGFNDQEKTVWLAQHVLAIWVFYVSGDPLGCSFDNFVRTL